MATLNELKGLKGVRELKEPLDAIDNKSEYPSESGLTYTQLLLPRFYVAGGRLQNHAGDMWQQLQRVSLPGTRNVVSMSVVAGFLADLFAHLRDLDSATLVITPEVLQRPLDA